MHEWARSPESTDLAVDWGGKGGGGVLSERPPLWDPCVLIGDMDRGSCLGTTHLKYSKGHKSVDAGLGSYLAVKVFSFFTTSYRTPFFFAAASIHIDVSHCNVMVFQKVLHMSELFLWSIIIPPPLPHNGSVSHTIFYLDWIAQCAILFWPSETNGNLIRKN